MTAQPLYVRVLAAAAAGAATAALAILVGYALGGGYASALDATPALSRGLYPTEHEAGGRSFAWTRDRAVFVFEGLDRARAWTLTLRVRAGRGPGLPPPTATIAVDTAAQPPVAVGAEWQELRATVPVAPPETRARPTRIAVDVAPTFVPGPGDSRTLGVIVDDVRLTPDGWPMVPPRALTAAAVAGASLAALVALLRVPLPWAIVLVTAFAVAQACALAAGAAPYTRAYLGQIGPLAFVTAAIAASGAGLAALIRRRPLSPSAGAAIAIAAIGFVLYGEGLFHPDKLMVDAMFHAHRLDGVLAGRYFFTQPMPSGVAFPYAIGLYVVAAPFASLTRDHVLLLRVVVTAVHVLAALSLYPLVLRRWASPGAAALAVAAYLLAPLPFLVIGNANQTYAFGQSIATIAFAAAMTWTLGWRRPPDVAAVAALVALLSLGLLSHVGLIPLLGGLVGAAAVLLAWRGLGEDRRAGWLIVGAAAVAATLAVGLYYRHFGDAFRSAQRVGQASAPATAAAADEADPSDAAAASAPAVGTSRPQRAARAAGLALAAYGAPLLVLAVLGLVLAPMSLRGIDGATALVVASLVVCAVVGGVSVLAPVEPRFERYTDEFISRLYYAVTPAVAVLAARGADRLWQHGAPGRAAAIAGMFAAVVLASRTWLGWVR